jgi:23S rRNA (uracil1939-C5)-methyltransferase
VKKRKQIILEKVRVEDYAAEGKSLARWEGKAVFVENAVPGDVVNIRLRKNRKDWAEGEAVLFHEYSPDRVEPFCSHFGVCGGCQWQMLPYEKQLVYKQKQVEEVLKRIGKIGLPPIQPILGAAETKYYRNKIEYTFGTKRYLTKEELADQTISTDHDTAGYHARGFFDKLVDIKTCFLQAEPTNELRLAVKDFVIENNWSFYDIREHSGFIRNMQVRLCTTGELMVNIVVGEEDDKKIGQLMKHVSEKFTGITTLLYTINKKWNDSLYDLEPVVYSGNGYVLEKLEEFVFKIGPKSFFQTNTKQAVQLYRMTREFAELSGNETVYDLYCGTGSIGIFLSKKAKKIVGVEMMAEAIHDAKENAALNAISTAVFIEGDVITICNDEFFAEHGKPDVIISDPPRAGMHEKLVRKILDIAAPVVVYVSCNPATQARDLNILDEKYEVKKIQPVDMFPHTHHIENVVQLKLR